MLVSRSQKPYTMNCCCLGCLVPCSPVTGLNFGWLYQVIIVIFCHIMSLVNEMSHWPDGSDLGKVTSTAPGWCSTATISIFRWMTRMVQSTSSCCVQNGMGQGAEVFACHHSTEADFEINVSS